MENCDNEQKFDKHDFEMADVVEWNPWWGCKHVSAGCYHCIAYGLIRRNRKAFNEPLRKVKDTNNKKLKDTELDWQYKTGTVFRTCTLSDFFIDSADYIRKEVWQIIHERPECLFVINTRRPERIMECLPYNWGEGWFNVLINAAVENEYTLHKRLPDLLNAKQYNLFHIGIALSPMIEEMDIRDYLKTGIIEHVELSGERYRGADGLARQLRLSWVQDIGDQCEEYGVPFEFISTGTRPTTLNGMTLNVWNRDQEALADFYNYSRLIQDDLVFQWRINKEMLETIKMEKIAAQLRGIINNS